MMLTVVFVVGNRQDCPKDVNVKVSICSSTSQTHYVYTWTETHPFTTQRRDLIPKGMVGTVILIGCMGEITCVDNGIETYYLCNDGGDVTTMAEKMTMLFYSLNRAIIADDSEFHVVYDGKRFPAFTFPKRVKGYSLPGIMAIDDPMWGAHSGIIFHTLVNIIRKPGEVPNLRGSMPEDMGNENAIDETCPITRIARKHDELREKKRIADENYTRFCNSVEGLLKTWDESE